MKVNSKVIFVAAISISIITVLKIFFGIMSETFDTILFIEVIVLTIYTNNLFQLMELEERLDSSYAVNNIIEKERQMNSLKIRKILASILAVIFILRLANVMDGELKEYNIIIESILLLVYIFSSLIKIKTKYNSKI